MKIRAAQGVAAVGGVAQARHFSKVSGRQIRSQPLAPGTAELGLEQVSLIGALRGATRSISEGRSAPARIGAS